MTRVLPAHVVVVAAVAGLALRERRPARAGSRSCSRAAPSALVAPCARRRRCGCGAPSSCSCSPAWWWGSARLDALDRSPLRADVGRAGRFARRRHRRAARRAVRPAAPGSCRRSKARASTSGWSSSCRSGARLRRARASALLARRARAARARSSGFDERTWLRRQGVHVVLHVDEWHVVGRRGGLGGVADRLRRWLRRASAPGLAGERRAVLEGIVLGDDAGLSDGLKTSFRRSGALPPARRLGPERRACSRRACSRSAGCSGCPVRSGHVAALAAIGAYVLAVGPQPSVIRAAVSGVAVSVAWLARAERDRWHVLLARRRRPARLEPVHAVRPRLPALVRRGARDLRRGRAARCACSRAIRCRRRCAGRGRGLGGLQRSRPRRSSGSGSARCRCSASSRTRSSSRSSGCSSGLGSSPLRRPGRARSRGGCSPASTAGSPRTSPPVRAWSRLRRSLRRRAEPPRWRVSVRSAAALMLGGDGGRAQAGVPDRRQRPAEGRPRGGAAAQPVRRRRGRVARRRRRQVGRGRRRSVQRDGALRRQGVASSSSRASRCGRRPTRRRSRRISRRPRPGTTLALVAGELRKDAPLAKAVAGRGTVLLWDVAARAVPKWVAEQFTLHGTTGRARGVPPARRARRRRSLRARRARSTSSPRGRRETRSPRPTSKRSSLRAPSRRRGI